ncbi:hypothetical protein H9P43_000136 [Blastocladiella emersonii ATCC 22665]|nr:hypothetical protein H9P43_000136 [Blastocladiella emersonii ATCC 22665]
MDAVFLSVCFPRAAGGSGRALSAAAVPYAATPDPTPTTGAPQAVLHDDYLDVCRQAAVVSQTAIILWPPSPTPPNPAAGVGPAPVSPPLSAATSPARRPGTLGTATVAHPAQSLVMGGGAGAGPEPADLDPHDTQSEPFVAQIRSPTIAQALLARANLMHNNPAKTSAIVRVNYHLLLTASGELKPGVKAEVEAIQAATGTQITVIGEVPSETVTPPGIPAEETAVEISGPREAVYTARIKFLVALDVQAGLAVDASLDLDPKCHYVVAGRKAAELHNIMRLTNTNIYLPSPFANHDALTYATKAGWENELRPGHGRIYITGERARVDQARDMLLAQAKVKKYATRQLHVLARKLDWMLTHRKDLVLRLMYDNGTFVAFPPLGSGETLITVYGDNPIYINRTLESIARIACDFYTANIRLLPGPPAAVAYRNPAMVQFGVGSAGPAVPNPVAMGLGYPGGTGAAPPTPQQQQQQQQPPIPHGALQAAASLFAQIAQQTETEIMLKGPEIEIFGSERGVSDAFAMIASTEWVQDSACQTRFCVELDIRHKDFISGKKNGKINKIVKMSEASILFDDWNDINMIMMVTSPYPANALSGFALLKDELPAEISFHVPETFHKRIIGVGGKNIQRIMKKYGVFVKFSNAEEHASQGGYFDNDDNVIARTPAKNRDSLDPLKDAIFESVQQSSSSSSLAPGSHHHQQQIQAALNLIATVHFLISIPIRHHRWVESCISGIEVATVTKIRMPNRETGSDKVVVAGPEPNVKLALNLLAECTPETYQIPVVSRVAEVVALARSQAFRAHVTDVAKAQYDIDLILLDDGIDDATLAAALVEAEQQQAAATAEQASSSESASAAEASVSPTGKSEAGTSTGPSAAAAAATTSGLRAFFGVRCPRKFAKFLAQVHDLLLGYLRQHQLGDAVDMPPVGLVPPSVAAAEEAPVVVLHEHPPLSYTPHHHHHHHHSQGPQAQQQQQQQQGPQLTRVASVPSIDSHFRHFNARLFSSGSTVDTLASGPAGAGAAGLAVGIHGGFQTTRPSGGSSVSLGYAAGANMAGSSGAQQQQQQSLRDIFGAAAYIPDLQRTASELAPGEAYAQMISPTTAAELPFLAPDNWSRTAAAAAAASAASAAAQQAQQQQQRMEFYPPSGAPGAGFPMQPGMMGGAVYGVPSPPQQHQHMYGSAGLAGGQQQQGQGQGAGGSGILSGRGIFELGSLMESLPGGAGQAGGSSSGAHLAAQSSAPARPINKTPSPLQLHGSGAGAGASASVLSTSPPTPLSLSSSAAAAQFAVGPASPSSGMPTELSAAQLSEVVNSSDPGATLCQKLGLDKYAAAFSTQEIDLHVLVTLTDAELNQLGVKALGPRKKLLSAFQDLIRFVQHG